MCQGWFLSGAFQAVSFYYEVTLLNLNIQRCVETAHGVDSLVDVAITFM